MTVGMQLEAQKEVLPWWPKARWDRPLPCEDVQPSGKAARAQGPPQQGKMAPVREAEGSAVKEKEQQPDGSGNSASERQKVSPQLRGDSQESYPGRARLAT